MPSTNMLKSSNIRIGLYHFLLGAVCRYDVGDLHLQGILPCLAASIPAILIACHSIVKPPHSIVKPPHVLYQCIPHSISLGIALLRSAALLILDHMCMHLQASVMSIWTKDQSKTADARAMASALAAANAKACQGTYQPPHPSVLKDSLHESFRGWNANAQSA